MKKWIAIVLLAFGFMSEGVLASPECRSEALVVVNETVRLFSLNDSGIHCQALGQLVRFEQLEVQTELPVRYAYEAEFEFMCGPAPRTTMVQVVLDESCKIVELKLEGFP